MNRLIVIGASAGGLDALQHVVASLDADLPAAVLVVKHMGDQDGSGVVRRLATVGALDVHLPVSPQELAPGHLYVAPPDHHLLVTDSHLRVQRGPRVNRVRPAIDLTMRSAAVAYRERVIGVVLSGMLDDGTAGLVAIKQCGGATAVQDPAEAPYPDMPGNALAHAPVDHALPVAELGVLLNELAQAPTPPSGTVPETLALEALLDLQAVTDIAATARLGPPAAMSCPDCDGPLWEVSTEGPLRYRCHVGHALSAQTMLAGQDASLEQSLWVALRTLEERARMLRKMEAAESGQSRRLTAQAYGTRAAESEAHASRLRTWMMELQLQSPASPITPPPAPEPSRPELPAQKKPRLQSTGGAA